MAPFTRILMIGAGSAIFATTAQAQTDLARCGTIADPAARLACYDRLSGRMAEPTAAQPAPMAPSAAPAPAPAAPASAVPAPATVVPAPIPAPAPLAAAQPAATNYAALRKRSNFDAQIVKVDALPYGLFRLHLADGTAYDTSVDGAQVHQGQTVHIRRSPFGTIFADLPGQAPIPVRLYRPD